jgi:hypothetical protein
MAKWSWRTLPDERVEVDMGSGYTIPVLKLGYGVDAWIDQTMQWAELAKEKGAEYGVPPSWILGIILAESGGDPDAENDCCVGLMAIMAQLVPQTRQELKDPVTNVDVALERSLGPSRERGLELPEAASVHNGGGGSTGMPHPSSSSPWGMVEDRWKLGTGGDGTVGYIDRVVRANNMFVELLGKDQPAPSPSPKPGQVAEAGMGRGKVAAFVGVGAALGFAATKLLPRL